MGIEDGPPLNGSRNRTLVSLSMLSTQNMDLEDIFEQIDSQLPSLQLGSIATGVSGVELIRCVNSLYPLSVFRFETVCCWTPPYHNFCLLSSPPLQALGGDCLSSFCGCVSRLVLSLHMLWGLLLKCSLRCYVRLTLMLCSRGLLSLYHVVFPSLTTHTHIHTHTHTHTHAHTHTV